jgi:hypothetical protein
LRFKKPQPRLSTDTNSLKSLPILPCALCVLLSAYCALAKGISDLRFQI